jgi:mRNA interferase RelE/StbE
MPYRVELKPRAAEQLRKLPRDIQQRISKKLNQLRDNPRPSGVQKLRGADNLYRVRLGDYRIVYAIDDANELITVADMGDRKDIYRNY